MKNLTCFQTWFQRIRSHSVPYFRTIRLWIKLKMVNKTYFAYKGSVDHCIVQSVRSMMTLNMSSTWCWASELQIIVTFSCGQWKNEFLMKPGYHKLVVKLSFMLLYILTKNEDFYTFNHLLQRDEEPWNTWISVKTSRWANDKFR